MSVKSLSSSAMLVELSISLWTARKLDRKVSNDVDISNSTQTKAGNYHKNLLAGDDSLSAIQKLAGVVRTYHTNITSPWNDSGQRLLPTAKFMEYKTEMARLEREYWDLVNNFLPLYNTKISASAFQLGALFNRDEYPEVEQVEKKFGFNVRYTPLPDSGDFRVDVGNEAMAELKDEYDKLYTSNLEKVTSDAWDRLNKILTQLSFGLRNEDGKKGKVYTSVLENAKELCGLLTYFNVSGDTELEAMRIKLEDTLFSLDANDFKESDFLRSEVKKEVDDMLSKWG